jgi:hypothetical protein
LHKEETEGKGAERESVGDSNLQLVLNDGVETEMVD